MSFGRELDSAKIGFRSMATWIRPMRGIHNPALIGDQRIERADEVQNPKEVMFLSRERDCIRGG
jgi:hypothetical protein